MNADRDLDLARALATLDVPEHRPGFWEALEAELVPHRRRADRRSTTTSRSRAARVARARSSGFPAGASLAVAGSCRRPGGGRGLSPAASLAVATLRPRPRPLTTAGEWRSEVSDALAAVDTLRGTLTTTDYDEAGEPARADVPFWRASDGSYRIEYPDGEIARIRRRRRAR